MTKWVIPNTCLPDMVDMLPSTRMRKLEEENTELRTRLAEVEEALNHAKYWVRAALEELTLESKV